MTFSEVEAIVGLLPPSALSTNVVGQQRPLPSAAWMDVVWTVGPIDVLAETVTFERGSVTTRSRSGRAMPPPIDDLEALFRQRMRSAPSRRATVVARTLGWCFSNGPDLTV